VIIDKLKQAGFRITKPRKEVIDELKKHHEPISAQELHHKLGGVDLVSIYRVLEVLEEIGEVQREESRGAARYFLSSDLHHHITCRKCGKVECVPCDHGFSIVKGFKEIKHQLSLIGTCLACSK
jgi:Fur family transcriptional regulator, stress-responsive regulator